MIVSLKTSSWLWKRNKLWKQLDFRPAGEGTPIGKQSRVDQLLPPNADQPITISRRKGHYPRVDLLQLCMHERFSIDLLVPANPSSLPSVVCFDECPVIDNQVGNKYLENTIRNPIGWLSIGFASSCSSASSPLISFRSITRSYLSSISYQRASFTTSHQLKYPTFFTIEIQYQILTFRI